MSDQEQTPKRSWWQRWQSGQALVEYWPTLPIGIMVSLSAAALVGPLQDAFQTTADSLSGIPCQVETVMGPTYVDLEGGHRIEVTASSYDPVTDRTTVVFKVSSGDQPSISHWVLGIDEDTADRIISSTEAYVPWGLDPTTGKYGIKFDTGYEGTGGSGGSGGSGKGGGPKKARMINSYRPHMNVYVEEREMALLLSGYVDFVETVEVTTKAGSSQVSTGTVSIPSIGGSTSTSEGCY